MKKKSTIILIISIVFLLHACNVKKIQHKDGIETETIDFYSFKSADETFESLVKEREYIKLDCSDEFLFKRIDKIKILDDRIYILDFILRKLIVFDRSGKGIAQVGQIGQGPEDYLRIHEFDVDNSGNIYFMDLTASNNRMFIYDKNLKFVTKKKLPFKIGTFQCLPDNKFVFALELWNKADNASKQIAITDSDFNTEKAYLEFDEYVDEAFRISGSKLTNNGEHKILYNKSINNYVYEISENGNLDKAYYFDFGSQNVPDEYKKDIEGNMDIFQQKYCCLCNFITINEKYIVGSLWDKAKMQSFVIERQTKKLYQSINYFTGYFDNKIITYIYSGNFDSLSTKNLPDDVVKYIEDENFVLCISTLK